MTTRNRKTDRNFRIAGAGGGVDLAGDGVAGAVLLSTNSVLAWIYYGVVVEVAGIAGDAADQLDVAVSSDLTH